MRHSPSTERVAEIARRLMDDGYVDYEVDAWRAALQLVAAHDALTRDADRRPVSS